jgi:hypothetical protein
MISPKKQLEVERNYFENNREEFVKHHLGKFALILGEKAYNFYDTEQRAYEEGVTLFGTESFMIEEVLPEKRVVEIPALEFELMNALR